MDLEAFKARVLAALENFEEDQEWGNVPKDRPLDEWCDDLTREVKDPKLKV